MKLYKIYVQHVCTKDEHTSLDCFLLAEDDEAVYEWLDKKTYWSDDDEEVKEVRDDDFNVISTETYKDYIIRLRGDMYDEDQEYSDLYYGLTLYGWEEVIGGMLEATVLKRFGILEEA